MKKKVTLLAGLLTCVTVGGVYATWTYAGNDTADVSSLVSVQLTSVEFKGSAGVYTIDSTLSIHIDQENSSSHKAVLKYYQGTTEITDGDVEVLTIKFTPSSNASDTVKEQGINSWFTFKVSDAMQYQIDANGNYDAANGTLTDIFAFDEHTDAKGHEITWTPVANEDADNDIDYFKYTMTLNQFKTHVFLSRDFILDSIEEYRAFEAALKGKILISVTDGITTGTN